MKRRQTIDVRRPLIVGLLAFTLCLSARAQSADYNISCGGQGKDGAYLVRVETVVKKVALGEDELKRCAVHGVLFRGFTGDASGCTSHKPLLRDGSAETTHAEFFAEFFADGGPYTRFVSTVEASFQSVKLKKKRYEVSALMLVDKEALLHALEDAGVVKGFSDLW